MKKIIQLLFGITILTATLLAFSFFSSNDSNDTNNSDKNSTTEQTIHKKDKNISKEMIKISDAIPEEYPDEESEAFNLLSILRGWMGFEDNKTQTIDRRPQLAIIIDDVSNKRQLKKIKSLHYPVTPSIFPPSELSMHSNLLAKETKHYMIHLPMQSKSRAFNSMFKTLFVTDSTKKMKQRVKEIRRLFPDAKYINNHTGSVFTSNYKAMYRLYGMLKEEGFTFIDSRTTAKTKVKQICKKYGDIYISRDIFLDNRQSVKYILSQLKKAVKIAKHRGYAIAIGHPHRATLKALSQAKDILKGIHLVYIDELVEELKAK